VTGRTGGGPTSASSVPLPPPQPIRPAVAENNTAIATKGLSELENMGPTFLKRWHECGRKQRHKGLHKKSGCSPPLQGQQLLKA
jgi:hypothetical protein